MGWFIAGMIFGGLIAVLIIALVSANRDYYYDDYEDYKRRR